MGTMAQGSHFTFKTCFSHLIKSPLRKDGHIVFQDYHNYELVMAIDTEVESPSQRNQTIHIIYIMQIAT